MSSMNLQANQTNELLYVGFNQDYGCFACGTDSGFRIYNSEPFKETFERSFSSGGVGCVAMLFRANILALVGGGRNPRYPPNKTMIWDDHQNRAIGELSFRSEVKNVLLKRDRVVVVLEHKIYVYNFADLKLVDHIETCANPKGLCALSPYTEQTVLACPSLQRGHVRCELYHLKRTSLIPAHEGTLACLALNLDGTRLATASEKGTLIRVFDTMSRQALQEVRRGADKAEIYSIAFDPSTKWLASSSDRGTVHVWKVGKDGSKKGKNKGKDGSGSGGSGGGDDEKSNPSSSFSFMKGLLPKYFSSEWSWAQFRVPDVRTIVAFGGENSIVVVSADGVFYKALFDPDKPGEMVRESYARFVKQE